MGIKFSAPPPAAPAGAGYGWASAGVGAATGVFSLLRHSVDQGQASLLYLPVVLACAVRFGFGPGVLCAVLSFLCWDFFFLPPLYTFAVDDPKDWLLLVVFLMAAVVTARLAAQAREQTRQARAREAEIATLFQASEAISQEVRADRLLAALTGQLQTLCGATRCAVFRRAGVGGALRLAAGEATAGYGEAQMALVLRLAGMACEYDQAIGFGGSAHLWAKALAESEPPLPARGAMGVYVPLHAAGALVGVLHVGPRDDGRPYSATEERLIRTLANHAAVVIARDALAEQAAQATALRAADALKDSLLSLVSHELRTPLAAIKASATGLLQPGAVWGPDNLQEALRAIDTEADRLAALVSNLLDLSRLEAGAWQPSRDWCDLAEIVGTVLDRLPEAEAARVQVGLPEGLPLVCADYTQVALVLTNLLENAIKYTPPRSPVRVAAAASAQGVTMTVRDFGPGLLPGEEERLFERFYRGRRHQDSTVHGTGLGLALCQAVMRAHGGRVWAGSAPAGEPPGAVFSLFIPLS